MLRMNASSEPPTGTLFCQVSLSHDSFKLKGRIRIRVLAPVSTAVFDRLGAEYARNRRRVLSLKGSGNSSFDIVSVMSMKQ